MALHKLGYAFLLGFSALVAAAPAGHADSAGQASHTAKAKALAGKDLDYLTYLCGPVKEQGAAMRQQPTPVSPFKIFDNVWFLGMNHIGAFAVTTSQGIILIDTLDNAQEADDYILAGLKKAGLNPQDVKYIVATHGHADHYGGMTELKAKIPGARLIMGPADWDYATFRTDADPKMVKPPKRDLSASDGEKLTLGDETITIYITPGHTPGSLALIIPVKDHGKSHVVSLWGGTSFVPDPYGLAEFRISLDRFRKIEKAAHSEGRLSTHPFWTNDLAKMEDMRAHPNGPNPFLESADVMDRYTKVQDECWQATIAQLH